MTIKNEYEATRLVVETLEPYDAAERERILRWARDKLGMSAAGAQSSASPATPATPFQRIRIDEGGAVTSTPLLANDIRSFLNSKNPRTDTQLAAAVAYYHRFVAPESARKESIGKNDLLDACRLAERPRPARPDQTMVNAFSAGYFDKAGRGQYRLNSVGENLVVMALPAASSDAPPPRPTGKRGNVKRSSRTAKKSKQNRISR